MPREADNRGNITSETRNGVTVTYEYDELGQLTRVNDPGDPAADSDNGTTWLFTYDRGGNILSKQAYVFSTEAQPTEIRQNLIYGYTDANWKDKLTHFCNDELTYDAIGNLTSDTKWTYTWGKGRQLKSMHNAASGVTMEFEYNHEGLRTRKVKKVNDTITETTDYILKGKHIVAMKKNTDTYYFTYDASGKPATVTYNGVKYTYVKNLQGDIVGILDSTGTLVVEYRYDAWGAPTSILCVNIACDDLAFDNPFRYRGYVWDEETELYYLKSRYYRPEWGRFVNIDSLFGNYYSLLSINIHAYCKNSFIGYKDDSGKQRIGITIYINEEYDTIEEMIQNMEFGHAELTIEGGMGRVFTYSYGRYDETYGSLGLRGKGIFIVDNFERNLKKERARRHGRSVIRYELNITSEEIYKIGLSITRLANQDKEPEDEQSGPNIHDYYQRYYVDEYHYLKNNCVKKTLGLIKDGIGDRFPEELRGAIFPYDIYLVLEEMLAKDTGFVVRKHILN